MMRPPRPVATPKTPLPQGKVIGPYRVPDPVPGRFGPASAVVRAVRSPAPDEEPARSVAA